MADEWGIGSLESSSDEEEGGVGSLSGFSLRRPANTNTVPPVAMKSASSRASSRSLTSLDIVVRILTVFTYEVWARG